MKPLGKVIGLRRRRHATSSRCASSFEAVDREFGGLDILVNNAGQGVFRKVGEMTPEDWHRNIDLNLNGPFYCSHEALARFAGAAAASSSIFPASRVKMRSAAAPDTTRRKPDSTSSAKPDARPPLRQCPRQLRSCRAAWIRNFRAIRRSARGDTSWMIAPEDIAETVALVLRCPQRTTVSRVRCVLRVPKK